jgi:hypothetical protein
MRPRQRWTHHHKGEPRPLPDSLSYRRMITSPEYQRRLEITQQIAMQAHRIIREQVDRIFTEAMWGTPNVPFDAGMP